ncbi:hypothetical protein [Streptomyces sp. AF1A]|uniref:hypothetical protein n=1 Tax=Streptomyces sp. AF1A TaxID=3394350 RepID=UPI0039BD3E3C
MRTYLDLIAGLDGGTQDARAEAVLMPSALIGSVPMARAVADAGFSDELLATVGARLK